MRQKTGAEIQGDVYSLLKKSELAGLITGDVYRSGYRPRGSRLEDAIIVFTNGVSGQVQEGIVTVNIYVPDITPFENGVFVQDGGRCELLEKKAAEWIESLPVAGDYLFSLAQTIYTETDEENKQHFVVVKLNFKLLNT